MDLGQRPESRFGFGVAYCTELVHNLLTQMMDLQAQWMAGEYPQQLRCCRAQSGQDVLDATCTATLTVTTPAVHISLSVA